MTLQGVEHVAFYPQREGLKALKEHPCIERRDTCALIAKEKSPDAGGEGCRHLTEDESVVGWVGLCESGELIVLEVVEGASVDDYASQGAAMTTDELCCRVYNDVGSMLYRADKIRSSEGVVDDQWYSVLMSYGRRRSISLMFEFGLPRVSM